jgi:hypothetical protein
MRYVKNTNWLSNLVTSQIQGLVWFARELLGLPRVERDEMPQPQGAIL